MEDRSSVELRNQKIEEILDKYQVDKEGYMGARPEGQNIIVHFNYTRGESMDISTGLLQELEEVFQLQFSRITPEADREGDLFVSIAFIPR